jgi:hypothetical protein
MFISKDVREASDKIQLHLKILMAWGEKNILSFLKVFTLKVKEIKNISIKFLKY